MGAISRIPDGPEGTVIYSVDFEVFGKVQGCSFPKYAKDLAEQAQLVGWIKNTKKGTIMGRIQGQRPNMETMVHWLGETGSPGCQIVRLELNNWEFLYQPAFHNFSIRF